MKKILCYGDSNVYGYIPQSGLRYDKDTRWSGVLAKLLPGYEILEEGMNNRTGFFKNPSGVKFSGGEYLSIYLQNHKDIDICILSLGTNDAQIFYNLNKTVVAIGLEKLIKSIRDVNPNIEIIVVPPVKITENILKSGFSMMFDQNSIDTIKEVFPVFRQVARFLDCKYLDFNEFVEPSKIDGLHYEIEEHLIIAKKVAEFLTS